MDKVHLEVVTPKGIVVSEDVEDLVAPGLVGEFGVLPGHAFMMAALKMGRLSYQKDGRRYSLFVSSGYAEVDQEKAILLVEEAIKAEDIDVGALRAEKGEVEERLRSTRPEDEAYQDLLSRLERLTIMEEIAG